VKFLEMLTDVVSKTWQSQTRKKLDSVALRLADAGAMSQSIRRGWLAAYANVPLTSPAAS